MKAIMLLAVFLLTLLVKRIQSVETFTVKIRKEP
jgi:hypothetical protein